MGLNYLPHLLDDLRGDSEPWLLRQPSLLRSLSNSAYVLWNSVNVALAIEDSLFFNGRSPDDTKITYGLDQNVADSSIRPHEHTYLLLENVTCLVELVHLLFCKDRISLLKPLDDIEGDLEWTVACRSVHFCIVSGEIFDLPLTKSLFYFGNNLLHVVNLLEVVLQVTDLHVCALDQVHLLTVGNFHLHLADLLQSDDLDLIRWYDVRNRYCWNRDSLQRYCNCLFLL